MVKAPLVAFQQRLLTLCCLLWQHSRPNCSHRLLLFLLLDSLRNVGVDQPTARITLWSHTLPNLIPARWVIFLISNPIAGGADSDRQHEQYTETRKFSFGITVFLSLFIVQKRDREKLDIVPLFACVSVGSITTFTTP